MSTGRKWLFIFFVAMATTLFVVTPAVSMEKRYKEVSAPEVKQLLETQWNSVVINVLSQLEFELQHIPKSINIPINRFETTSLLPEDKDTPLLLYCMENR